MPDPDADALGTVVEAVQAGTDAIAVPGQMLEEAERPATPEARSLYAEILSMGVPEKIKLALRGNKDARSILLRDANKVIRRLVLQNPRITDAEVVQITHQKTADEELLRVIADRREWAKNYQIRLGLVTNPRTPLPVALKHVSGLLERDLRTLAKSRNVPQGVAAQARRLVLTRFPSGA